MIVLPNTSQYGKVRAWFFGPGATTATTNPNQIWTKPPGCSWVSILCVGAGGGGGAGSSGAAGTNRGGGGGGSSGAVTRGWWPSYSIPDTLLLYIPGPVASANSTYIAYWQNNPNVSSTSLWCLASSGNVGSSGATQAGGSAPAANAGSGAMGFQAGVFVSTGGQAGSNGGATTGAAGSNVLTAGNTRFITGGAGGGGTPIANTNFAGGGITGSTLITPTLAGGTAGGGRGNDGIVFPVDIPSLEMYQLSHGQFNPFSYMYGGTGGGTNGASGTGGRGGDGALGCGGGGGGAGVTGGAGGLGGGGFVYILCG